MSGQPRLFSLAEIAEFLGVTHETVRIWIRNGEMGCIKLARNNYRIAEYQVKEFLLTKNNSEQDVEDLLTTLGGKRNE